MKLLNTTGGKKVCCQTILYVSWSPCWLTASTALDNTWCLLGTFLFPPHNRRVARCSASFCHLHCTFRVCKSKFDIFWIFPSPDQRCWCYGERKDYTQMQATWIMGCHFCPRATLFCLGIDGHSFGKERMTPSQPSHSYFQDTSWLFSKWKFALWAPRSQTGTEVVRSKLSHTQVEEQHGFSDDFVPLSISSTMSSMHKAPDQQGLQGLPRSLALLKHLKLHVLFFWCRERHQPFLCQSLQPGQDLWDYSCACKANVATANFFTIKSQNHRIIEHPKLEGTLKGHLVQLFMGKGA